MAFVAAPTISSEVTRVEVGYFGAAAGAVRAAVAAVPPRSGAQAGVRLSRQVPLRAVQAGSFAAALARSALWSFPRLLLIPLSDERTVLPSLLAPFLND